MMQSVKRDQQSATPFLHGLRINSARLIGVISFASLCFVFSQYSEAQTERVTQNEISASSPSTSQTNPVSPKTDLGRDFISLKGSEVDGLTRAEKKRYYGWLSAQKELIIQRNNADIKRGEADNKRGEADIQAQREEQAIIDAALANQKVIKVLLATYKTHGRLTKTEKDQANAALQHPSVPAELRSNLKKVFGL